MNQTQILKAELFGKGMIDYEDRMSNIKINHVPVMITDKDKILCIPTNKEISHIGITAMTGKGKGILGNTMLGFEYWMLKRHCMILNDFQRETFEMSLPCMNAMFEKNLEFINTRPLGLPIVYIYPSSKYLNIGETEKRFPHLKMSMPTRLIIKNIEQYYKLDKSAKYFTANIDRFIECKDLEEIDQLLSEIINENVEDFKNKKSLENMMFKIKTVFKNIFDEKITDNASPDASAILNVKRKGLEKYYNDKGVYNNLTIQSIIALGFIPSIQTSEVRSMSWFSAYMSFIVESLYEDASRDLFFKDNLLRIYVPELDKMWKGEHGNLIKKSLSLVGTNGRSNGLGFIWDAQDYGAVPSSIRSNTGHLFVLRKSNSEEVRDIIKDYSIDKDVVQWILNLKSEPKKGLFECVALTNRDFILYSLRTGGIERTSEPQRGRLITPMAHHKNPGVPIKDII